MVTSPQLASIITERDKAGQWTAVISLYLQTVGARVETVTMYDGDMATWGHPNPSISASLDIKPAEASVARAEPLTKIQSVSVLTEHTRAPACSSPWPLILVAVTLHRSL